MNALAAPRWGHAAAVGSRSCLSCLLLRTRKRQDEGMIDVDIDVDDDDDDGDGEGNEVQNKGRAVTKNDGRDGRDGGMHSKGWKEMMA